MTSLNFDIDSALQSARHHHRHFSQAYTSDSRGLRCLETPLWAQKDIRKFGELDAVLKKISSGTFMRRRPENNAPYAGYVKQRLEEKQPIEFRLGCGPLKNVRVCAQQQPDCAEYLMFTQLTRFAGAIASLYPYGVRVEMVPDDQRACRTNLCPQSHVCSYIKGLQDMVAALDMSGWLTVETGQQRLCALYNVEAYTDAAETYLLEWKRREPEAFAEKWQRAVANAARNVFMEGTAGSPCTTAEDAAWRYLVAHQAEIMSGLWSADDRFPLRYGRHPQFYQLYTMKENQTQLPWQISLPFPDGGIPMAG